MDIEISEYEQVCKARDGWKEEAEAALASVDSLREHVRTLSAIISNDVWIYQGNQEDFPDSLTCRVVMTADQLRRLLPKPKCSHCNKRCNPGELDEVGFCDYCAING